MLPKLNYLRFIKPPTEGGRSGASVDDVKVVATLHHAWIAYRVSNKSKWLEVDPTAGSTTIKAPKVHGDMLSVTPVVIESAETPDEVKQWQMRTATEERTVGSIDWTKFKTVLELFKNKPGLFMKSLEVDKEKAYPILRKLTPAQKQSMRAIHPDTFEFLMEKLSAKK